MSYTAEQVQALRSFVKQAKTVAEVERARVLLAFAKRKKRTEVAEIFEIHVDTLDGWQTAFMRVGIKVIANKGYPGNHYKLTKQQKAGIRRTITGKKPEGAGIV